MDIAVIILCIVVMLAGLAGTILPVIPGIPMIWLSYLGYGLYDGWQHYSWPVIVITGLVAGGSMAVDQLAAVMGAKKFGASRAGMVGSFVGAIAGLLIFSLPGLILGTFFGAFACEALYKKRNMKESLHAGTGALVGFLAGSLFKFMVGTSMLIAFIFLVVF